MSVGLAVAAAVTEKRFLGDVGVGAGGAGESDVDVAFPNLGAECVEESDKSVFRGAIDGARWERDHSGETDCDDDVAGFSFDHGGEDRARQDRVAGEIDVHHFFQHIDTGVDDERAVADAGVIEEVVDAAEAVQSLARFRFDFVEAGEIERQRHDTGGIAGEIFHHAVEAGFVIGRQNQKGAGGGESGHECRADTRGSARDPDDFILKCGFEFHAPAPNCTIRIRCERLSTELHQRIR